MIIHPLGRELLRVSQVCVTLMNIPWKSHVMLKEKESCLLGRQLVNAAPSMCLADIRTQVCHSDGAVQLAVLWLKVNNMRTLISHPFPCFSCGKIPRGWASCKAPAARLIRSTRRRAWCQAHSGKAFQIPQAAWKSSRK